MIFQCALNNGISFEEVEQCFEKEEGTILMVSHGNTTNRYKPLTTVPTILYNNTFHRTLQKSARDNPIGSIAQIKHNV